MLLAPVRNFLIQHRYELVVLTFFLFLALFIPKASFDWASYVVWAQYIQEHGLSNIYQLHYVNYMPLNIFAIHLWQVVVEKLGYDLVEKVHWLKLYAMLFDCMTVLVVLRLVRQLNRSVGLAVSVLLLNIAFHYNSCVWGQFDSVYTFFSFLSLLWVYQKKYAYSSIAYLLALNAKLQAIIFLPLLLLVAVVQVIQSKKRPSLKRIFTRGAATTLCLLGIQWLLFMPFTPHTAREILSVIWQRSSELSSYVTFNADNFWLIVGAESMITQDTALWLLGLSYKSWGMFLFFVSSGMLLLAFIWEPIIAHLRKHRIHTSVRFREAQLEQVMILAYMISLQFFFFFTQMHERYGHPAVLFATVFFLLSKKPGLLILTSVAYLVNMERVFAHWWFTQSATQLVALDRVAAWLYAFAWLYGVFLFLESIRGKRGEVT